MNPFKEILLPYQKKIFSDHSSFICILASRQIGKSLTISAKAVYDSLVNPKSLACIISTNERSSQEVLRKVIQWAEACRIAYPELVSYSSNASSVTFQNGSRIITLPSTPNSLRGFSGSIYWDEAAICDNDQEMWAAMLPIITTKMTGTKKVCISSTPTSLDTVFSKIWHSEDSKWSKHKIDIYEACKQGLKASPEELKAVVNDDLIWNTEFCCQFASGAGTAFPTEFLQDICYDKLPDSRDRWIGFDVARRSDFSAIVVAAFDKKTRKFYVEDVIKMKDKPFNEQLQVVKNLNSRLHVVGGFVDQVGVGAMLAEEIQRTVNPKIKGLTWTASNKTELHDNLRTCIQNGNFLVNPSFKDLIVNDFANMRRYISSTGHISYSAPHNPDGHSDVTSAIVLALQAVHANPLNAQAPATYQRASAFGNNSFRVSGSLFR